MEITQNVAVVLSAIRVGHNYCSLVTSSGESSRAQRLLLPLPDFHDTGAGLFFMCCLQFQSASMTARTAVTSAFTRTGKWKSEGASSV